MDHADAERDGVLAANAIASGRPSIWIGALSGW